MANRRLAHAVRVALMTAGAASAGLYGGAIAAQEPLEEIVVTGTRIRDANLISSSPVATVSSDEFKFSGTTRVEDLLNTFPQLAPSFDSFTVNPTTGFATADLRGLGSQRTLVLVNGHRLPPGGIRSEARDLNQIPAALVKRVEVLTGGASAVYGSDAMAGVVNFILDTDFEGVSFSAGASGYQHDNNNKYLQGLMDPAASTTPRVIAARMVVPTTWISRWVPPSPTAAATPWPMPPGVRTANCARVRATTRPAP
jgi:iron complex outermembrane recepter protein